MKVVEGTHSMFQMQGNIDPIYPKKWMVHTAILPYTCPPCCINTSAIISCLYKESDKLKSRFVSKLEPINLNDNKYDINELTVPLLKDELRAKCLSLSRYKPELRNRMTNFLKL